MTGYLETHYKASEAGVKDYPQLLCDHINREFFASLGPLHGKRLLDIGSGKGNHLLGFSRAGIQVTGVDKRSECVSVSKDLTIVQCDIESEPLPFPDETFDFVYSKSVIEHVQNTDAFLAQSFRVLKRPGMAVVMTPDWESQYKHFWDDHTHVRPFTRKSLQNALALNGFTNVDCRFFYQLPFLWKYPAFKPLLTPVTWLPDSFKWKDARQSEHRKIVRFAKEKMLLAVGYKL